LEVYGGKERVGHTLYIGERGDKTENGIFRARIG